MSECLNHVLIGPSPREFEFERNHDLARKLAAAFQEDITHGLGKAVRMMRKAAGLNQDELAKAIGLSRTSVVNMEAGRQVVSVAHLMLIAEVCGYEVKTTFRPVKPMQDAAAPSPASNQEKGS